MNKILTFISHVSEERELTVCLRDELNQAFLNMVDFFISTDEGVSLPLGRRWLDKITDSLKQANILIVLCSPDSIIQPWINFESGAGWVREIPVIPICHSGLTLSELPVPLAALQAFELRDKRGLDRLFNSVASAIGCSKPRVDYDTISAKLIEIEQRIASLPKRITVTSPGQANPRFEVEACVEYNITTFVGRAVNAKVKISYNLHNVGDATAKHAHVVINHNRSDGLGHHLGGNWKNVGSPSGNFAFECNSAIHPGSVSHMFDIVLPATQVWSKVGGNSLKEFIPKFPTIDISFDMFAENHKQDRIDTSINCEELDHLSPKMSKRFLSGVSAPTN